MHTLIARHVFALGLCAASPLAWASDPSAHLDAAGFTLDTSGNAEWLLSDNAGTARISLSNAANWLQLDPNRFVVNGDGRSYSDQFTVNVRPGFKVTSIGLSGSFVGNLLPFIGPPGDPNFINGSAYNDGAFTINFGTLGEPNSAYGSVGTNISALDGTRAFSASTPLSLDGAFGLYLDAYVEVIVESGARLPSPDFPRFQNIPSYAGLRLDNVVLTIQTTPVPEPESWAMLVAGLAGLAVLRRRAS